MTIAHLFSQTVLTRPKNKVITFFLFCLVSIDTTLTAIVGDRLLPYWYSTIAAGGICVPTSEKTRIFSPANRLWLHHMLIDLLHCNQPVPIVSFSFIYEYHQYVITMGA